MYRSRILYSLIKIPIDLIIILLSFVLAAWIRSSTDLIPYIQLPIQRIPQYELLLFAVIGSILWVILFGIRGCYQRTPDASLSEELLHTISQAFSWFVFFIGIVYLGSGFIFTIEIPRLIIFFAYILITFGVILSRIAIYLIYIWLASAHYIRRQLVLVVGNKEDAHYENTWFTEYELISEKRNVEIIKEKIRERKIDILYYTEEIRDEASIMDYISLCKIYGIRFAYPKIERRTAHIPQKESSLSGTPVMEASSVTIEPFERVIKRCIDILFSFLGLIILSPLFIFIALLIKIEDPSGPVIYKNRRVGIGGKEFSLYKFRYMYWKYSVKDGYGVDRKDDIALQYEENLKGSNNTRSGPLYKIENDPRKTKIGTFIEKFSIDELPQLFNVLIGNMSLVGPRPHQPREVADYEEYQYQVLTIKPGITGMAQTHGREKNNFADEVALDTYYIENYSLGLDIMILLRTIGVVFSRAFGK